MRFLAYDDNGTRSLAVVLGDEAIDLTASGLTERRTLENWFAADPGEIKDLAGKLASAPGSARRDLESLTPLVPVARPGKIICLGLNYALHAKEGGHEIPTYPELFVRFPTSLVAAGEPVVRPVASETLDYEVELMVVIGKRGRHIKQAEALNHVFGYTAFNDVSVREFQRRTKQWTAGKNFDGTGPVGPVVVTPDELPQGGSGLRVQTRLNGEVLQDSDTSDMIFSVARTIEILSEIATLEPGDMIAMGTPSGVGHARQPQLWMKPGDVVEVEIEGIGILRNPVVDERDIAAR